MTEERPAAAAPSVPGLGAARPGSRLNLRRPNQLLPGRGRINPLAKTAAPATSEAPANESGNESEENVPAAENKDAAQPSEETDANNSEPSTPPPSGINKLRNRPRLQVQPRAPNSAKSSTAAALNINRKPNPLLARRKLGASSTTTGKSARGFSNLNSVVFV